MNEMNGGGDGEVSRRCSITTDALNWFTYWLKLPYLPKNREFFFIFHEIFQAKNFVKFL